MRTGPGRGRRHGSHLGLGQKFFENIRWPSRRARSDSGGRQSRWTQCRSPLAALPAPAEPVPESKLEPEAKPARAGRGCPMDDEDLDALLDSTLNEFKDELPVCVYLKINHHPVHI